MAYRARSRVGHPCNRRYIGRGRFADPRQQVSHLDPGTLSRLVGEDLFGLQTARSLAPPYSVVRLRILSLLKDIQHGQHEQRSCGQGQQRSLHAVKEACLHERGFPTSIALQHVGCHALGVRHYAGGVEPII